MKWVYYQHPTTGMVAQVHPTDVGKRKLYETWGWKAYTPPIVTLEDLIRG